MPGGRWAVVLPVLNEAAALPGLLAELASWPGLLERAVFVDNGSTDGSRDLLAGANVRLTREDRRGYDYACHAGARVASAAGAEVVVFMEADGTDDPRDLPRLLGPTLSADLDLLIGSRAGAPCGGGSMPVHQRLGNGLTVALFRLLFGLRIPDNGPFRAVRTSFLESLHLVPQGFTWTTRMLLEAHLAGGRIAWVQTAYRQRRGGASKIGGTWKGTVRAARAILGTTMTLWFRSLAGGRRPPHRAGFRARRPDQ